MSAVPPRAVGVPRTAWRAEAPERGERLVASEVAVAFTYQRATHAVMMATPADLEDFAFGFSRTEQIIERAADIAALDVLAVSAGIELRITLREARNEALAARRRHLAGPSGCGLCGIESLAEAMRVPARVGGEWQLDSQDVEIALAALAEQQALGRQTRAVHAAGFWAPGQPMLVREDVGRHNALDKLAGALVRQGRTASGGCVVLTSRVSVEMVQKCAVIGAPVLVAVSAPTALALQTAEQAGIMVVAVARADGFEVFTHPQRLRAPLTV